MKSATRQAEKQDAAEAVQVARERQRQQWTREGHDPRAHLDAIGACEGEIMLLIQWGARERHYVDATWPSREQKVPSLLAAYEIAEIIATQRYRRY